MRGAISVSTWESALDMAGDVTGTGMTAVTLASNVVDDAELVDALTYTGTFVATGAVTLGDNGDNVTIDSSVWDITAAGAVSGLTSLTSSGTITFSGLTADGVVTVASGVLSSKAEGSGNGLDADTLDSVDSLSFLRSDANDSFTSGTLTINDDLDLAFGSTQDWTVQYDEGVDDQLLFITSNTAATAITDPLVEFLVGTTPTANQQVFGIAKGTQASNTALFTVDEDGDVDVLGALTLGTALAVAEGGTGATTLSDLITLGTHTTGNYAATIADAGNSNITVANSGSENAAITLDVIDVNCTDCLNAIAISDIYLLNS